MSLNTVIIGTGSYLPEKRVTNAEMAKFVDTSDEWIQQRTGIKQRHFAADEQTTSDMALEAARKALTHANVSPADIDGIIVATTTPDLTFPSTAVLLQHKLGMTHGFGFDVQAVCSGFVYGISVADAMLKNGSARRILLVGAEKMSAILNWEDRTTCVLFGDGAGAVILEAQEDTERGILSTHLHSNGAQSSLLKTSGGASSTGDVGVLEMQGRDVFKYAVQYLAEVVDEALEYHKLAADDLDWIVPHQANIRIIESTAKKLNFPMERVVVTLPEHGNTSAASIPLALDKAVKDDRIRKNQLILIEAMGGGFTWGSSLIRF